MNTYLNEIETSHKDVIGDIITSLKGVKTYKEFKQIMYAVESRVEDYLALDIQ